MEYTLFKPKKYADPADWKSDLAAHVAVVDAFVREGASKTDDLQLFLCEVVWAVVKGDLSVAHAVELLKKTPVATKDPLQRLFADVLWLVSFSAMETGGTRESRDDVHALCAELEKEGVLPRKLLATSLETESVPPAVCQVAQLKKKHNQSKTKARYTITRYNLLRENSEGYSKLLMLFSKLAGLDFEPQATEEQMRSSEEVLAEDVVRLAGFDHLCPNRMLSIALEVYEMRLVEESTAAFAEPMLGVLRRFPPKRITEVVTFQLVAHNLPPSAREALKSAPPQPPPMTPPSRESQFLAVASLVQRGLVDLDVLWSYLAPTDAALKKLGAELAAKHDEEVASVTKIDLASSSSAKDVDAFNDVFQEFNRNGDQKIRLAAGLISVNSWRTAHRVLLHLAKHCKPCLNHYIRSALCDILKWVIAPLIAGVAPVVGGRRADGAGPSMEATFGSPRRFALGLAAADAAAEAPGAESTPLALRPSADFEECFQQIRMVLYHLEYYLHTDLILLTSLWRMISAYLQSKKQDKGEGETVVLDDRLVSLVYRHLLPAASLVPNNPHLSDMMWSVMQQLSIFQRFMIYSCWETTYDNFLLKLVFERTKAATKQVLKRVVSNAERRDLIAHQSHFHICKLCHSNPIPCIETMLKDVEIGFNVNMIQPYVECTNRCSDMTADIMSYILARSCAKPVSPQRQFLNQKTATLSPWLVGLGEFIGRFYKKHPHTDLVGLLTVITKRISSEAAEISGSTGDAPVLPSAEYRGESLIRVIFESLVEHVGGLQTVSDMTQEQLVCLAGGPRLKTESVSIGKKNDDAFRKDRARQALLNALINQNLVPVLWNSLSQQRHHFLSEEFSERHGAIGGLKLLGLLFDGNHECFLKLTEFLCQACSRDKYAALLPPLQQVFSMFEPSLAFLAIRHGLPPFGRPLAAGDEAEPEAVGELERVVRLMLPKAFEEDGLAVHFYMTFWRLSLQDIFVPSEGYERAGAAIQAAEKDLEQKRKDMERRDRDFAHSRESKAMKKETAKLNDFQVKLHEEHLQQKLNHKQVVARLEQEKSRWFPRPSPSATACFVSEMICPRVLTSHSDALFCCHFVRMLIRLKTHGFQLLDFYNSWTIMLTQCIRSCSEREAQIFGVFLREMMAYVMYLRKDEATFAAESKDNPCFHRNYYEDPTASAVEWAQFADIQRGHGKWEGRIFKAIKAGLDSDEWMERRNTLLLLSHSHEAFPLVEKYARAVLSSIDSMREKEEFTDLKTLANSLSVKLKSQKERWVDRAPPEAKEARRAEEGASRKSMPAPKNGLPSSAGKADGDGKDRDRDRDRDRAEKDKGGLDAAEKAEKRSRSRRGADDGHNDAKESGGRDHKESGAADRKRSSAEPRGHEESGGDRKRGAAEIRGHEERSDKRRRSDREEPHSSRGGGRSSGHASSGRHGDAYTRSRR